MWEYVLLFISEYAFFMWEYVLCLSWSMCFVYVGVCALFIWEYVLCLSGSMCIFYLVLFNLQYYKQNEMYILALDYLNMIFTGVFAIEFILKLFAFRIKASLIMGGNLCIPFCT